MDLADRLMALGLNKSRFAALLGVSKQAVDQWKGIPESAEERLLGLERESVGTIPLGAMVKCDNGEVGRVVIIERNECLYGSKRMRWVYLVSEVRQSPEGWEVFGPARRWPEGALAWQQGDWKWAEKKVLTKAEGKADAV